MNERRGQDPLVPVVVSLAAVVALVWCGAELAVLATRHEWVALRLGDAVGAAFKLPRNLARPADAWAPAVAHVLPGAAVYWVCTAAAGVAAGVVAVVAWGRFTDRPGPHRRVRLGVDTASRLASVRDLSPLVVRRAVRGRFVLGSVSRRLVATEDRRGAPATSRRGRRQQGDRSAVAVIGPARCGKTANVIAGVLEWEGPAILSSVRSDLLEATLARRREVGEVRVFDPTGSTRYATSGWSPLRAAGTLTGAQKAARALLDAGPNAGAENLHYFSALAEQLLWPLLHTAAVGERTMADVLRWLQGKDRPAGGGAGEVSAILDAVLVAGAAEERAAASAAMTALEATWQLDDRTKGSAYATARTLVRAWEDPMVAAATATQEIDLDWLLRGNNTLYLCAPSHEQQRLAPVFGGLLGDLLQQAYERANLANAPLPNLLLVMDEAGNTPTTWLPSVASTCAGIGILLVTVWQSVAQIEASYGQLADSVLTNHGTKLIFSGVSDPATMRYASSLLGEEDVLQRTMSADVGGSRRSVNESTVHRDLVPADVLRMVAPFQALLVHGTLRPAHLHARPYYRDRRLRRLAEHGVAGRPGRR